LHAHLGHVGIALIFGVYHRKTAK